MRLLITGGSGLLGSKIAEIAVQRGYQVYSGYNKHKAANGTPISLDICKRAELEERFRKIIPEVVIHAAALTNVDKCEQEKRLAWTVNVEGTKNIVDQSKKYDAFLIDVSTDYVFSGTKELYKENDETNPINNYGLTKLKGEEIVKGLLQKWCIVRPSVIYGSTQAAGKVNFALWLINKLREKETVKIITDQWVSPTLNTNLAEMILEITERRLTGVYHLAGATPLNRYEFAQLIAETFNLDKNLIKSTNSNEMNWIARRPKNTTLNVEKASETLKNKPLEIEEALKRLKEEISLQQ